MMRCPQTEKWSSRQRDGVGKMTLPNVYNRYRYGGSRRRQTDAVMQIQLHRHNVARGGKGEGQHFPPISRFFFLFSFLIATRGKVLKSLCATFTGVGSLGAEGRAPEREHSESCPFISQAALTHTHAHAHTRNTHNYKRNKILFKRNS